MIRTHRLIALEESVRDLNKYKDIYRRVPHGSPRESSLVVEMKRAFHKGGVNVIAVTGKKGVGKSAFSILLVKKLLGVEDPKAILDHVFFAPTTLYRTLLKYSLGDVRIPAVVVDDAGVWLSGFFYNIDRYEYVAMRSLLQLIRPFTANLILTLPTLKEVSKSVKPELTHIVHLTRMDQFWAVAKIYKIQMAPLTHYIKLYAQIRLSYNLMFSEIGHVYREYENYRNRYINIYYDIIESARRQSGQKKTSSNEEGEGEGGEVYEDINDIDVEIVEG